MKSSLSNPTGNSVDVVINEETGSDEVIEVRDTKIKGDQNPKRFTVSEWEDFIGGVIAGEFTVNALRKNAACGPE